MINKTFQQITPTDFLDKENRCDYNIDSHMKRVWLVQLELLYIFSDVCRQHNLKFWLIGGSLLGAVRHKGYIPWDDDIDVVMPRRDYEILCANAKWFDGKISLHLPNNRERYYEGWARLHNTETAVLYPNYKKEGSKQGIYLDILPLDDFSTRDVKRRKRIAFLNTLGHSISYNINSNIFLKLFSLLNHLIYFCKPEKLFKRVNKLCESNPRDVTDKCIVKVCTVYPVKKNIFSKEDFSETLFVPFEFITVPIPKGFDHILSMLYGDYHSLPPSEKRGTWHDFIFSTDKSFKDFQKKAK